MSEKLFTDAKTLQTKNQLVLDACEITLKHPNFQSDLIQLTKNELSLVELRRPLSDNQISRLLETASLFALTNDIAYEKLAYKMAVYLLSQYKTDYPTLPAAVEIIMSRLGDLPTIHSIIENQDGKDYFSYFEPETFDQNTVSTYLKFPEVLVKKITNRIKITDQKSLTFTDFQARIYSLLREKQNVIFSAPTSTGKSYVLHNYIAESLLNSREYCAVYIAPTKALIAEVQANIEETITSFGARLDEFAVFLSSNFLNMEEVKETKKKVFVLTQERLQEAMANNPLTNVKLLVVDEAQKISDESRGVIIEDAVQDLIEYNPNVQKVVISPYTQNPEKFKLVFNIQDEIIAEKTSKSPVGQNFFLVKFEGKKVIISLLSWGLEVSEEEKILYEMTLESLLPSKSKRKAWVVNNLVTKGEPTIIYCDRPYDCRRVAENIAEGSEKSEPSDELKKAIDFFSEYVHKQYYLCDSLKNRIGYHYGKMPQFVRFLVKNLFERKKIDLLCCTSTLLEGVNLPAKNIVLYNPKAGKIMDRLSLLNLAGRAGRLRKDYYGKIYCINMDEWESGDDVFEAKLEDVESSVEQTLAKNSDSLIEYLKDMNYNPPEERLKESVKTLATSLLMKQLRYPDSHFLESLKRRTGISDNLIDAIRELLVRNTSQLFLDKAIILKNRSIDPRFQNDLYLELKLGFEPLPFPLDPLFYQRICWIFQKISKHLFRISDNRYKYYAYLASRWILEDSYKSLIEGKISHNRETGRDLGTSEKSFVNRMIDELDEDIETTLKYDYTRTLKCYQDITEGIRRMMGDNRPFCRELPIFLEEGTFKRNTLFLLEAGFSRNVAKAIADLMGETKLGSSTQTVEWIKLNMNKIKGELPEFFFVELEDVLNRYGAN